MIISIVNRSKTITDEQLQTAIRAINRQLAEDFEPYWSFGATLRLEGAVGKKPNKQTLPDLRGDAILYLWDDTDVADALGRECNVLLLADDVVEEFAEPIDDRTEAHGGNDLALRPTKM